MHTIHTSPSPFVNGARMSTCQTLFLHLIFVFVVPLPKGIQIQVLITHRICTFAPNLKTDHELDDNRRPDLIHIQIISVLFIAFSGLLYPRLGLGVQYPYSVSSFSQNSYCMLAHYILTLNLESVYDKVYTLPNTSTKARTSVRYLSTWFLSNLLVQNTFPKRRLTNRIYVPWH